MLFAGKTKTKQIVWDLSRTGFTVCPVFSNCDKRHMTAYGGNLQNTNMEFRLWHLLMSRPSHIYVAKDVIHSVWGGYGSGNPVMIKNGCIVCARRSRQTLRIHYYCKPARVDIHWRGNARAILASRICNLLWQVTTRLLPPQCNNRNKSASCNRQRQRTEERPPTYWYSFSRYSIITLEDFWSINPHKTLITERMGLIAGVRQDNILKAFRILFGLSLCFSSAAVSTIISLGGWTCRQLFSCHRVVDWNFLATD